MSIYRQHVTFVGTCYIDKWKGYCMYLHQQNHFYGVSLFFPYHYGSQFQSVSGSDEAYLKNNLIQTRSSEFSDHILKLVEY